MTGTDRAGYRSRVAVQESEVKIEIPGSTALDGLDRLPGVSRVRRRTPVRLVATYFDSPGLRLARVGVTLRRRTGGKDAGWHLKLPGGKKTDRFEVRAEDTGSDGEVPRRLLEVLTAHRGSEELTPVARVRTERTAYQLLADDGTVLVEVADDRVSGQRLPDGDEVTWREVEVELAEGDEHLLDVARRRLSQLDGATEAGPAKLFRTLGEVPRATGLTEPRDPGQPTATLVQARIGQLVDELRHWDPLVRERLPGGVHQVRKAVRRLRDGLATARPFLQKAEVVAVRDELKWLSHEMGAARDAEVQEGRLRHNLEDLGTSSSQPLDELGRISSDAQREARDALTTDRYLALLARLDDLAASPPWRDRSAKPIEDAYLPRVERDWKRLAKRMRAARDADDPTARADALHECRKATKRFRYAVEPLVPMVGQPAKGSLKDAKRLQQLLGEHHDAVLARRTVQRLAADAAPAESFALGTVHEREFGRLTALEADVHKAWKKANRQRRRRWFG